MTPVKTDELNASVLSTCSERPTSEERHSSSRTYGTRVLFQCVASGSDLSPQVSKYHTCTLTGSRSSPVICSHRRAVPMTGSARNRLWHLLA